eukprot:UN18368
MDIRIKRFYVCSPLLYFYQFCHISTKFSFDFARSILTLVLGDTFRDFPVLNLIPSLFHSLVVL